MTLVAQARLRWVLADDEPAAMLHAKPTCHLEGAGGFLSPPKTGRADVRAADEALVTAVCS